MACPRVAALAALLLLLPLAAAPPATAALLTDAGCDGLPPAGLPCGGWRRIAQGGSAIEDSGVWIIESPHEWAAFWGAHRTSGDAATPPPVDFAAEWVAAVVDVWATPSAQLEIVEVVRLGDDRYVVAYDESWIPTGPDVIVTVSDIVAVPRDGAGPVTAAFVGMGLAWNGPPR